MLLTTIGNNFTKSLSFPFRIWGFHFKACAYILACWAHHNPHIVCCCCTFVIKTCCFCRNFYADFISFFLYYTARNQLFTVAYIATKICYPILKLKLALKILWMENFFMSMRLGKNILHRVLCHDICAWRAVRRKSDTMFSRCSKNDFRNFFRLNVFLIVS